MSPPLMICSQKLFLCKQTSAGELELDCLEKSEILLEGIWGGASRNDIPRSHFPWVTETHYAPGACLEYFCTSGRPFGSNSAVLSKP